jgi:hypothetical protein
MTRSTLFLVPTLPRGNANFDAPASANYTAPPDRCRTHSHAGAWEREEFNEISYLFNLSEDWILDK